FRTWFKTDRISWVDEEHMHITLKFIGDTPADRIPGIHHALTRVASAHQAFQASITGAGVFGSTYKPRVLWLGVEDGGNRMAALGRDITGALEEAGIPDDRQNFVPHLTLGRIKYLRQRRKLDEKVAKMQQKHLQDITVGAFHLIESVLGQEGPEYTILHSYPLKSSGQTREKVSGLPWWKNLLRRLGL
ncbi:MAG TPA: RNA 2',3'-cyclic phosphodiesterase, partial [Bacteroidales bacterium]|nr:RNA 2',3'-cyclic phosphodiesterase [Bacteroidales bacterium]